MLQLDKLVSKLSMQSLNRLFLFYHSDTRFHSSYFLLKVLYFTLMAVSILAVLSQNLLLWAAVAKVLKIYVQSLH